MSSSLNFDALQTVALIAMMCLIYLVAVLVPVGAAVYAVYWLLTLPMRRNERASMVLDLFELGLKEGRAPEAVLVEAGASHDRALGKRFDLLAAQLRRGLRLSQALEQVPRLLPPQITAMLKTGERIGDLAKVLPACRQLLRDGVSHVRGALNYLLILAFMVAPFTVFVPLVLKVKVVPKFNQVFQGMLEGRALPAFTRFVFIQSELFTVVQVGIVLLFWLALVAYLGGPWLNHALFGLPERLFARLPWRRKRLQRDFSSMLSVLLDAEVPEAEAVALAAESTANLQVARRANIVCALLKDGVKLPVAIRALDDSKELHWRLANVLQRGGGFLRALTGWHEALDAKAFQLEQSAAQITTTLVVLFNGLFVACITIAVFLAFIQLINEAVLW